MSILKNLNQQIEIRANESKIPLKNFELVKSNRRISNQRLYATCKCCS